VKQNTEIIMKLFQCFISAATSLQLSREVKHWDNFKIISQWSYFTCNHGMKHTRHQHDYLWQVLLDTCYQD